MANQKELKVTGEVSESFLTFANSDRRTKTADDWKRSSALYLHCRAHFGMPVIDLYQPAAVRRLAQWRELPAVVYVKDPVFKKRYALQASSAILEEERLREMKKTIDAQVCGTECIARCAIALARERQVVRSSMSAKK